MAVQTYGNWAANWQSDVIPALHCQTSLFYIDWAINERSGAMVIDDKYLRRIELKQSFSEMCYELPQNEVVLTYDNTDGYFDESPFTDNTFGDSGIECRFYFSETDKMQPITFYNPAITRSGTTVTISASNDVMSGTSGIHFTTDAADSGAAFGGKWWNYGIAAEYLIEFTNGIGATSITVAEDTPVIMGALLPFGRVDETLQRLIFANNAELLSNRSGDKLTDDAFTLQRAKVHKGTVPSVMLTDRDMMEYPEYIKGKKYSYISTNYSQYTVTDFSGGFPVLEETKTYNFTFAGATEVVDPWGASGEPGTARVYRIWIPFANDDEVPPYAYAQIQSITVTDSAANVTVRGEATEGRSSPYGVYLWCSSGDAQDPAEITGTVTVQFMGKVVAAQHTDTWTVNTGELATIGGITFNNQYGMPDKTALNALVTNNDTISFTALCDISLEAGDFIIIKTSRLSYICRLLEVKIKYDGGVRVYGKARVVKPFAPVALWAGDNLYLTDKATNA